MRLIGTPPNKRILRKQKYIFENFTQQFNLLSSVPSKQITGTLETRLLSCQVCYTESRKSPFHRGCRFFTRKLKHDLKQSAKEIILSYFAFLYEMPQDQISKE